MKAYTKDVSQSFARRYLKIITDQPKDDVIQLRKMKQELFEFESCKERDCLIECIDETIRMFNLDDSEGA